MAYLRNGLPARYGLGAYQKTPEPWSWLYYPPPYAFADPLNITPPAGFYASPQEMGMAGCGCGCNGAKDGCGKGLGLGLFESGLDFSQWGFTEWALAIGGIYAVNRMFQDVSRGTRAVRQSVRRRRSKNRRRDELKKELATL